MKERIVGILGGMGPEATWDVYGRIIRETKAARDGDHLRVLIDSNPKIPDRTRAIVQGGESPVEALIATGKNLERAGADFLIIPCMTAHYFFQPVQDALRIPIIHALRLLSRHMETHLKPGDKALLIATSGSIQSGLYQSHLRAEMLLVPDGATQEREVMDIIYGPEGIKAGFTGENNTKRLAELMRRYQPRGATHVIAGCTEIGLALKDRPTPLPVIDPLDLLAREAVRLAKDMRAPLP
jgi:aspartate racemase